MRLPRLQFFRSSLNRYPVAVQSLRAQLKDKLGGREIAMSRLQDWLVESLNAENLTITAATKHPAFSLLDRQRLQTWQRKLYTEIETATDLLLPVK